MKSIKRLLAAVLAFIMIFSISASVFADNSDSRVVLGADLSDEQISAVYDMFGISRGSVWEMTVTNAEERQYLSGFVDSSVIGTRSISCVYLKLMPEGSGIDISCVNISWSTAELYKSALVTAGVSDVKVIVAAPFEVSGTAALTGIYKAYEDITGKSISNEEKLVSTQELTITGEIAEDIGDEDTTAIVNDLKLILSETKNMSDSELKTTIKAIAATYKVSLSEGQLNQLVELCRSLEKLNVGEITQRVEDVKDTVEKIAEAKDKIVSFAERARDFLITVRDFFERLKALFS